MYFALFHAERFLGRDPSSFDTAIFNAYIVNLWISAFWSSIGAVWLFGLFVRVMGFTATDALWGALVYGLCTLVFPFDTALWGHPTAAAFLIIGHAFLVREGRQPTLLAGFCIASSVLTEYVTLASVPLAFLYVASQRTRRRELPFLLLGALPPIVVLLLYQKLCFGGWFATAAAMSNPILEGADFQLVSGEALWSLLLSLRRGAIVFMPILAVALVNASRGPRRQADRKFFLLCALNVAVYLFVIASFRGWHGGNATGPRYLIVALPFWCLLLPALSSLRPSARMVTMLLVCWSFLNMLIIAAVDPMVHFDVPNPLGDLYVRFIHGHFSHQVDPFYIFDSLTPDQTRRGVFNLGQLLHVPNTLSTVPLLLVLSACLVALFRSSATIPAPSTPRKRVWPIDGISRLWQRTMNRRCAIGKRWDVVDGLAHRPPAALVGICVAVFLGFSAVALSRESCTFDEGAHLLAGHAVLARHDYRLAPDNPPLARVLAAVPIQWGSPRWPSDEERWRDPAPWHLAFEFLYQSGNHPDRLLLAARIPTVLSTIALMLVVYRASRQSFGPRGGVVALVLITFCPAFLAYGHLSTPDVLAATFIFLTLLSFRRLLQFPGCLQAGTCGLLLGCSLITKFNAICLIPVMGGMILLRLVPRRAGLASAEPAGAEPATRYRWTPWLLTGSVLLATVCAVVWAGYGFRYRASPDPTFTFAWDRVAVPGSALDRVIDVARRHRLAPEALLYGFELMHSNTVHGLPTYALGLHSTEGWWWYFPLAFLVKTPVSMLVLYAAGVAVALRGMIMAGPRDDFALLLLTVYWILAMSQSLNLGLRHLLPVYPAFIYLAAGSHSLWTDGRTWTRGLVPFLLVLGVAESVAAAPSYLAYFNVPSRALGQPHQILADSNLDWGQDLSTLKRFMDHAGIAEVKLSYFGVASPYQVGLRHQVLPAFNVYTVFEREWKAADPFEPGDIVAISATSLAGVYAEDKTFFQTRFGNQQPIATIGNSILVYRVADPLGHVTTIR